MKRRIGFKSPSVSVWIASIVAVQVLCGFFFIYDIFASVFGLRVDPIDWQVREFIEIGGIAGLVLGSFLGIYALRKSESQLRRAEGQARMAAGAFMEIVEERFSEWDLTAAERDVALFALKGMSIQEIAGLRHTSDGTVKAQTNAIYRKAGVNGRPQLLSLFMDELMGDAWMVHESPDLSKAA